MATTNQTQAPANTAATKGADKPARQVRTEREIVEDRINRAILMKRMTKADLKAIGDRCATLVVLAQD